MIKSGYTPKYWRTKTKTEVDFIIERDNKIIPIEVKLTETKTGKGLRSFIEKYKPERAYIVILKGENKTLRANGCKIKFINVIELKKEI